MRSFDKWVLGALLPLFAGTALVACRQLPEQPTQPEQQSSADQQAAASHSPNAASRSHGAFIRPAWGNDHLWEFISPKPFINPAGKLVFGSPSNDASHKPFYVIGDPAGDDGAQAVAFFGPHDHVFAVPPGNKGTFNANWHINEVTPADGVDPSDVAYVEREQVYDADQDGNPLPDMVKLVYAADIDDDGDLEDLTSLTKVEMAIAAGLVEIIPTPEVFICPVRDIEG